MFLTVGGLGPSEREQNQVRSNMRTRLGGCGVKTLRAYAYTQIRKPDIILKSDIIKTDLVLWKNSFNDGMDRNQSERST